MPLSKFKTNERCLIWSHDSLLQRIYYSLCAKYVRNGAPQQINIPSYMHKDLMQNIELAQREATEAQNMLSTNSHIFQTGNGSGALWPKHTVDLIELFDRAQHEIFLLMRRDGFPRFILSPFGKRLIVRVSGYNSAIRHGYLIKKSGFNKSMFSGFSRENWQRRWFVLRRNCIQYYPNQADVSDASCKGTASLAGSAVIKEIPRSLLQSRDGRAGRYKYAFILRSEKEQGDLVMVAS